MRAPPRTPPAFRRPLAVLSRPLLPLLIIDLLAISSPAAAQDAGHVRVQFSHGGAWSDAEPRGGANAPLPPGPGRAGYDLARHAEIGAPQSRLRLRTSNFDGL